jgi:hypothetical protein
MLRELRRRPDVLRVAKAKNGDEDRAQEQHSDRETGAFPESLCDTNKHHNCGHKVDDWNAEQHDPPERFAGDLEQDDQVVDRNDRCPAGLACLGKDLPHPGDNQDGHQESDDRADAAAGRGTVIRLG